MQGRSTSKTIKYQTSLEIKSRVKTHNVVEPGEVLLVKMAVAAADGAVAEGEGHTEAGAKIKTRYLPSQEIPTLT